MRGCTQPWETHRLLALGVFEGGLSRYVDGRLLEITESCGDQGLILAGLLIILVLKCLLHL